MELIKQNKFLKIAVIILLLANLGTVATVWLTKPTPLKQKRKLTKEKTCKQNDSKKRHYIIEKLDLSDEQIDIYKKSKREHFKRMQLLKDSIHLKKELIHEEMFKQTPDTLLIKQLSDSIGQLNAKFEKHNYQHFLEIKNILDDNQRDKFKLLIKDASSKKHRHYKRKGNKLHPKD